MYGSKLKVQILGASSLIRCQRQKTGTYPRQVAVYHVRLMARIVVVPIVNCGVG